ncbi:hypothetical protein Tco_0390233 [Tanacetum coccineum]|uniref:Uncharacterized protein n=1 Tax=Tanacetum coccineum TaxID=301880 RepID=A0ABQ4XNZ3_9ASTR
MGVSHNLRGDSKNCVPRSLHWRENFDSHTGNHPKDDFMPFETIRISHSTIGKRIPFELEEETFKPERRARKRINVFLFTMSAKDFIAIQTCELSEEEFNEFLALYSIPSSYHVILPKSNQTILDAPPRYKLTTFVVMCKAYGCEPTIELFRGTSSMLRMNRIYPFYPRNLLLPSSTEAMADSKGSPKCELFVVHPGSVAARMKNRKCKTRGGSSRPPVKRKLAPEFSNARATCAKTSASKDDRFLISFLGLSDVPELIDATACHLKISAIIPLAWKNHLDNHMDLKLLDLYDRCYARQAVVDNAMNKISQRERAQEEESDGLRAKCEAAMSDFEKNLPVIALRQKITTLSIEEVDDVRRDRIEVVLKVVLYAAIELIHSDELGSLVGKLVTYAIVYRRCKAFDQVASMKEPFDLTKVKGYRSSYKKEHNQAGNDLTIVTFPWLSKFVADPSAPVEVLLLKKPLSIQRPAPSKTQDLVAFSQKASPSSVPSSNTRSSSTDTSVVKLLSF